jgi:uncharacterized protein (DUF427 family)
MRVYRSCRHIAADVDFKLSKEQPWDSLGSRDHWRRERSDDFSSPNRCRPDCCSSNLSVAVCGFASVASGLPTANASCSSTSPAGTPLPTSPKPTSLLTRLRPASAQAKHRDLGPTKWFVVGAGDRETPRAAWEHTALPAYASELQDHVAFAWRAMDSFYEEDERILGHAVDQYHRIDIRQTSRPLVVRGGEQPIADSTRPLVLCESGFAPRWYVPRGDVDESALTPNRLQTFCPYKGVCSYYDIGDAQRAAWSYRDAFTEVTRVSDFISFEPDKITVLLDDKQLQLEPGQTVVSHGIDRDLTLHELTGASTLT